MLAANDAEGLYRFPGGLHPNEHKHARDEAIEELPIPSRLYLPLRQHAGAPAEPLVAPGEPVKKGMLLAESGGRTSATIHAPTSGRIVGIEQHIAPHPSGLPGPTMILESDGLDEWGDRTPVLDPFQLEPDEVAARVEAAGVVGMGGAAFPASVKLKQGRGKVEILVINGAECEPYLTCDDRLMRQRAETVVDGVRLMMRAIEAPRAVIGIESNKPEAIEAMITAAFEFPEVEVASVPTRFPTGSGKQLIYVLTGREVPAGARSYDIGVLIHNVATAGAVSTALRKDMPLISRIVTVSGGAVKTQRNFETLIGTPVSHLLEAAGGLTQKPARLVLGGPMTGHALESMETPVVKGSSAVLALTQKEIGLETAHPCIRCARCVDVCPMGLVPFEMIASVRADDLDEAKQWGMSDCILCGSCAYTCPSHIPLVQYINHGKGKLWEERNEKWKKDQIAARIQARTDRVERRAAEKKAAAKKKAAERKAAREKKKREKAAKQAAAAAAADQERGVG